MTYEDILVETRDAIALVTLNRPERMNAWTFRLQAELNHAFAAAEADDAIRAVVVTGAGRAFCAGADLSGGGQTFAGDGAGGMGSEADAARMARKVQPYRMRTPIIAAINGPAVGAGLTLPMMWDLRVVAEDAKLGFVFNRRGVMPDADLIWTLPRMIGYGPAMDVLLTGRIFDGAEARALGLAHRAVRREAVVETALALGRDIAANTAPASVAITKRLMYDFLTEGWPEAARLQREMFDWTGRQADAREGVLSFVERRPPAWSLSKTRDWPEALGD
ncbi:enoyl-CoA hydratase-related protein [Phenylobacterium sp.]|uniref:enoyl-CoA hydratase-related protein n=1 Tax=Phenylobacterium sp. TaxID=1871053 RepID=UPI0025F57405|nr:enoyl-CoA hydratase-related protein [Phenylobacterium sp.]MBX3482045.1 enoyl-CoA hydratase/isomerase family protein [Phenylobacterium sp.]MCW5758510.1 enoyl-CoA hydratase/isomerase family protein [Phenylobacterium sp.]